MGEGVSFLDEYYLDYKNVDKVTSNLDGSMTITFFNKRDRSSNLPGNTLTLPAEIINGWKNVFQNSVEKETIQN